MEIFKGNAIIEAEFCTWSEAISHSENLKYNIKENKFLDHAFNDFYVHTEAISKIIFRLEVPAAKNNEIENILIAYPVKNIDKTLSLKNEDAEELKSILLINQRLFKNVKELKKTKKDQKNHRDIFICALIMFFIVFFFNVFSLITPVVDHYSQKIYNFVMDVQPQVKKERVANIEVPQFKSGIVSIKKEACDSISPDFIVEDKKKYCLVNVKDFKQQFYGIVKLRFDNGVSIYVNNSEVLIFQELIKVKKPTI